MSLEAVIVVIKRLPSHFDFTFPYFLAHEVKYEMSFVLDHEPGSDWGRGKNNTLIWLA